MREKAVQAVRFSYARAPMFDAVKVQLAATTDKLAQLRRFL